MQIRNQLQFTLENLSEIHPVSSSLARRYIGSSSEDSLPRLKAVLLEMRVTRHLKLHFDVLADTLNLEAAEADTEDTLYTLLMHRIGIYHGENSPRRGYFTFIHS